MPHFDCDAENAFVLLIDVQERFLPAIPAIGPDGTCSRACRMLLEGAGLLELPVLVSEQYVKGLGETLPELLSAAGDRARRIEKTEFSAVDHRGLRETCAELDRRWAILAGIEAHVCVLATAADLLRRGYDVLVCADAVASRDDAHRDLALETMRQLGALTLPVESVLFRIQRRAGVGCFKALSKLVR